MIDLAARRSRHVELAHEIRNDHVHGIHGVVLRELCDCMSTVRRRAGCTCSQSANFLIEVILLRLLEDLPAIRTTRLLCAMVMEVVGKESEDDGLLITGREC